MYEKEDNGGIATSNKLTSGQEMNGRLATSSDRDTFEITTTSDGMITVDFDSPTSSNSKYFYVSLWDGHNTLASKSSGRDISFCHNTNCSVI